MRLTADQRRTRIIDAAIQLMAQRGYDAISVGEIAEAAGCSKAVLYDHFRSKAELAIAAVKETGAALMEHVTAAVITVAGNPKDEQLRAGFNAFFEFTELRPDACRMVFRDPSHDADVFEAHVLVHQQSTAGVAALLATGFEPGEAPDPERLEIYGHITTSLLAGMSLWWERHPDKTREELVDAVMSYTYLGLERLSQGEELA